MSNNFSKGFVSIFAYAVVFVLVAVAGFGYVTYKDQQKIKNTQEGFRNMNLDMAIDGKNKTQDTVESQDATGEQSSSSAAVNTSIQNKKEVVSGEVAPLSLLKSKGKFLYNLREKDKSGGQCAENRLIVSDDLGNKIQDTDVLDSAYYCTPQNGMVNSLNFAVMEDAKNSKQLKFFTLGEEIKTFKLTGVLNGSAVVSSKGNYIAVGVSTAVDDPIYGGYYPEVFIYKKDGTLLKKLIPRNTPELGRNFFPVFWSEDESTLFIDSVTAGEATNSASFVDLGATAQVFSVDLNSGKILKTKVAPLPMGEVAPSPDGRHMLVANSILGMRMSVEPDMLFKIKLIDVNSGAEKVFISNSISPLDTISWYSDSKRFLFVKGSSEINVGDIESGSYKKVFSDNSFIRGLGWVSDDRIVFVAEDSERNNHLFSVDIDGNNKVEIAEADMISIIDSTFGGI